MNTNAELGKSIIHALSGPENIKSMAYCATRLRIQLNDQQLLNLEEVKAIPGVLGVVEAMGGVQVIIGNNVSKIYAEIQLLYNFEQGAETEGADRFYDKLLNLLSAIIGPAIPPIMGSGLLSAILVLAKLAGANEEGSTYMVFSLVANVVMYFLPVILAYTAAIRFKCSPTYAIFFGGLMLHPELSALLNGEAAISLFGIPITAVNYASTLIPIILTTWILSYVEKFSEKYIPDMIKYAFKPLVIILAMTPITLCVTGPAGVIVSNGLAALLTWIYNTAAWLALIIVAGLAPFMVLTGMHLALIPLIITNFDTLGYDNLLFVAFIGMNFSQFAVATAVFFKTKQRDLKQLSLSCAATAFLSGITEPTLYGITVRLKKPLIATVIGCLANAIFCAINQVKTYAFGAPSFFTMPVFINPNANDNNFMYACIAAAITIAVTFTATWILGFDDSIYAKEEPRS